MTLTIYTARWFSSVDWGWNEAKLLAETEDQVRAWVDEQTAPEWRFKPYRGDKPPEDSLTITALRTLDKLPFVLKHHDP